MLLYKCRTFNKVSYKEDIIMNNKNIVAKNATMRKEALPKNYVLQIRTGKQQVNFERWLPCVAAKYEAVLQELGLSYKVEDGRCSFWNPEVYEEDVVTLPVFRQVANTKDMYMCIGQMKVAVPNRKTVTKAVQAKKAVMKKIEQVKSATTKVDREYLEKVLNGKTAKAVKIKNAEIAQDIGEDIKVLPAVKDDGGQTGVYGIFNTKKLQYVPAIKLAVSEQIQNVIEGQNQQYWEYMLDKEIELIPV